MSVTTKIIGAMSCAFMLTGCQEYLVRSDLVEPYSGNAVASNQALQTIDPWPRHAYDSHIATGGQRQGNAIKKYNTAGEAQPAEELKPIQLVVPSN